MTNRDRKRQRRPRPYPPQAPAYPFPVPPVPVSYAVPAPPFTAYPPGPDSNPPSASVTTLQDKNASVARVVLSKFTGPGEPAFRFEASGSAKREQGDVYDPRIGELLALSRAYQQLSRDLAREGNKLVKTMTEQQVKAREEAARRAAEPPKEVRHRTLAEWQEIQRQRGSQQMRNAQAQLEEDRQDYIAAQQFVEQQIRGAQAGYFWDGPRGEEAGPARHGTPQGVNSGNTGTRVELSGGRWISVSEGLVLLHEPGGPSVITRA